MEPVLLVSDIANRFSRNIAHPIVGHGVRPAALGPERRERAGRDGRNPQTGEIIKIAPSNVPGFKAGKALKDAVNS